jgi:hypothetical protein
MLVCNEKKNKGGIMKINKINFCQFTFILFFSLALSACVSQTTTPIAITRIDAIPAKAMKMTPEKDAWPPISADEWSQPVPLGAPINTAGGEDSPFITPDGNTLYFFFTPDVNLPAENQVGDGITGIWQATRNGDDWLPPKRLGLAEPGQPHLDGCPFVRDDWMAFCSARSGNQREIDIYTAEYENGNWTNIQNWEEPVNQAYRVGELHIANDGNLYFGSDRSDGLGGFDLWVSRWNGETWEPPINLGATINTANNENRPFITADGQELWFDGTSQKGFPGPAIFRSHRQHDGSWGPAEEIISSFAGEPALTEDGNTLYFVHHYFSADLSQMIEADIYVSHCVDTNK